MHGDAFDHPPEDFEPLEEREDPEEIGPDDVEPREPDTETIDKLIARVSHVYSSAAAEAFIERRLQLQGKHGAAACTDISRGAYTLARDAYDRIGAALDRLRGHPTAENIELAAHTVTSAGAILAATWDAIAAERGQSAKDRT